MENAEEVLQLLEEFSKIKPKDIPRELEDYLGYVAKTGDPVYQWTLVKHLFREKLLTVITDFYESTSTVELPTCPNVEPFNYERMKTSLLERFDSFSSAPFTVQRICELLTNPRKEYNRADKYMRAIEKNILVVSTREPGSGKRSLECDSQTDTVLNGIPDIKSISDPGSLGLLHGSAELPFLGAPPASNDVTVETTELSTGTTINDRLGQNVKTDLNSLESANKTWSSQDSNHLVIEVTQDIRLPASHSEIIDSGVPLNTGGLALGLVEIKSLKDSNCEVESKLVTGNDTVSTPLIAENLEGEESSDIFTNRPSCETVLPDSIDSSDSFQQCKDERQNKLENEEIGSVSDENEVSSTPGDVVEDRQLVQEDVEDPTDSEAEATDSNLALDTESDASILADSEINSSDAVQTDQSNQITISEITDVKSDVLDLECNEITGTIDSPVSPEINNSSSHSDKVIDQTVNVNLDQSENPDSHPDSSNDICLQDRSIVGLVTESQKPESCIEADSVSESNIVLPEAGSEVDENTVQCQTNDEISINLEDVKSNSEVSSPDLEDKNTDKFSQNPLENIPLTSISADEAKSEEQFSNIGQLSENTAPNTEVQSSSEVANDMSEQEKREDTVIQSIPNILPDSQHQIEDISVDTNCEAEEEAMDVDDCSNQMMVSEGENEGEPMDQSDQLHS